MREYYEFESLVKDVFLHHGFEVHDQNKIYQTDRGKSELDFAATCKNKRYAVEVKFYRQSTQNTSLLKKATNQLLKLMDIAKIPNGILVVSSYVSSEHIEELERLGIMVIARPDIFYMASDSIELSEKLSSLLEDDGETSLIESRVQKLQFLKQTKNHIPKKNIAPISSKRCLCSELKSITSGKKRWPDYENKCTEILKYLFGLDLTGWQTQQRTDDGLSRFDLITRIRSVSDFWMFICNELDSRYVLFEFKNYQAKLNQGQILTTEKYLHKRALRSVAFIISRKGISENALKFSQGAMREHGKLIINLTDEDLCKMLDMKENGNDPNDYMFEMIDSFLMSLPR